MGQKETGGAVLAKDDASTEQIALAVPRDLVIDYLKVFDELERATHAHRQFLAPWRESHSAGRP